MTLDGERTLYGVFLFDRRDTARWRKRAFEGDVSLETLVRIMDKTRPVPEGVREYPRKDCK